MDSHKTHRKHKKDRKKKKRRHKSSSSSDSSSEDEWIEAPSASTKSREEDVQRAAAKNNEDNDQWTSFSDQFRTRQEIQEKRKPKDKEERVNILDKPGQSARELNPYWADGGSGLPEEVRGGGVTSCAVGDFGLDWMRRAMRRAKEQALEEKRSLEEVVAERWGSLSKLESLIAEAEEKQKKNSYKSKYDDDDDRRHRRKTNDVKHRSDDVTSRRRFVRPRNESSGDEEERGYRGRKADKYGEEDRYDRWKKEKKKKSFARPRDDDDDEEEEEEEDRRRKERGWRNSNNYSSRSGSGWKKKSADDSKRKNNDDDDDEEEKDRRKEREWSNSSSSGGGGWRKKSSSANDAERKDGDDDGTARNTSSVREPAAMTSARDESEQDGGGVVTSSVLTADERNELAAKLVKAEIMGNTELAAELKSRLERAREAAAAPERVVLTVTDSRGFTQPLAAPASVQRAASGAGRSGKGRSGGKAKTHDDSGKRVRYFADDDRFTLQEMFEREKRNTAEDQNEMFARLAGKKIGDLDSARDMDDVFEESAARRGDARQTARDEERARARAIGQHQRSARAHDNCHWCLDSQHLLKHVVVAIGNKVYLCLPPHESLAEGHCLIVTSQHVACCVQADEDVWEEIQVFRKALVDLFLSQDLDCVFFEHAAGFAKFPHLVVQCVPLPKEQGDLAPIYFKKAILECETEWSTNKKLIDLTGKSVRRCVPRSLPYFFVDFGLQPGYAHVIEDEQLFPKNFAQEIVGGMLDVDHSRWRKPRREKFDDQRKKVVEFTKLWKPFDFTKKSND